MIVRSISKLGLFSLVVRSIAVIVRRSSYSEFCSNFADLFVVVVLVLLGFCEACLTRW
jgi:hypothetical protein